MMRALGTVLLLALCVGGPAFGDAASRGAARKKLETMLTKRVGPAINVGFEAAADNPFRFAGVMRTPLRNCDAIEIVIGITPSETIYVRAFPRYQGGYVSVAKATAEGALLRAALRASFDGFFFWAVDESGDLCAGYTLSLESGFPEAVLEVVLRSLPGLDATFGQFRVHVDGSAPAPVPK